MRNCRENQKTRKPGTGVDSEGTLERLPVPKTPQEQRHPRGPQAEAESCFCEHPHQAVLAVPCGGGRRPPH